MLNIRKKNLLFLGFFSALVLVSVSGFARSAASYQEPINVKVANIAEDLSLLSQEVAKLRLEVEILSSENVRMRDEMASMAHNKIDPEKQSSALLSRFNVQMETLGERLESLVEKNNKEVLKFVEQKIAATTQNLQKSQQEIAKKVAEPKPVAAPVSFSEDYPKQGIVYEVEKGDTLSHIAIKLHSTVPFIINANKIADPKGLKVGQSLFIPQKIQENQS